MLIGKHQAFSLLEMLMALTILLSISLLAQSYYQHHFIKAARINAMTEMLAIALRIEHYRLEHNFSYLGAKLGHSGLYSDTLPSAEKIKTYSVQLEVEQDTYQLTATPYDGSTQINDGVLTLNHTGKKTWNGVSGWDSP